MRTSINYTAITPNLELEKAFSTDYHVDHIKGAVRSNTKTEYHPVSVNEIQEPEKFQLDVHGFCVLHGKTHLDPLNAYKNKSEVEKAYWYEIEAILHENFPQYSRIESFDLTVSFKNSRMKCVQHHNCYLQGQKTRHRLPRSSESLSYRVRTAIINRSL